VAQMVEARGADSPIMEKELFAPAAAVVTAPAVPDDRRGGVDDHVRL